MLLPALSVLRESVLSYDSSPGSRSLIKVSRGWGLASLMRCAEKDQQACWAYERKTSINVVVPDEEASTRVRDAQMQNRDICETNRTISTQVPGIAEFSGV